MLETDCVHIDMEDLSEGISLRNAYPLTDEQGYNTKPYRFRITNTCNIGVDYHVNIEVFDIANRMSSKNVAAKVDEFEKKILTSEISTTPTYTGDEGTSIESYNVYTNTLSPGESKSHDIRIWLDESAGNDSQNKEFKSKIVIEAIQNQIAQMTFSEYIIDQSKSQDRGIERIEHEATEQTPALKDYRYTGANPNNYVYFGCSENCTEENLYRIIGVIPTQSSENGAYENRVKLIKASNYVENESGYLENSIGPATPEGTGYRWNKDANINNWEESSLNIKVLNNIYWNSLGEYQKYIEPSKWYLGSLNNDMYELYTVGNLYNVERSNVSSYSGGATFHISNIGLMYPSDYGYSISKEYWNNNSISNYQNEYIKNAWLYNLSGGEYVEWLISASHDFPNGSVSAWNIGYTGNIWGGFSVIYFAQVYAIRPTFYLKSSIMYGGGLGTKEEPFQIIENSNRMSDYVIAKSTTDETIEKVSHEATEQTPALMDYRYTGTNPNNYVCFGYEGERCPDENLYRIIGVIPTQSSENGTYENRVKLIKASEYIGSNAEDTIYTSSGKGYKWNANGTNKWEESTLKEELNTEYWTSLGEYQRYIETTKWYLGSNSILEDASNQSSYRDDKITIEENYNVERSNTQNYSKGVTSYINNIGLIYPSDYGYSLDKNYWFETINGKDIYKESWLYNFKISDWEWTISAERNQKSITAWLMNSRGIGSHMVTRAQKVRPTFYLKSSVLFRGGEGTIDNPYYLSI